MRRSLLLSAVVALAVGGVPALADPPATGTIKDRTAYIPVRKHAQLPGKAVGILLANGKDIYALDGWSGPPDILVFSSAGNSYRKVYVPTSDNPQITNFRVPVGTEGKMETYPALNIANPRSVIPWGITAPYSLVEVTVNSGMGAPPADLIVGTNFKVLDGTKEFPLKVADAIAVAQKRYAERMQGKDIEQAMADAAKKFLADKSPTGPREKAEWMYVSWMPESATLVVRFKTKLSDGAYTIKDGPNPKINPKLPPRLPPGAPGAAGGAVPFRAIARPVNFKIKTGTMFGVEFGQAFEINKQGEIVRIDDLPIEAFSQQVNQNIFGPGPGPGPIPPRPVPLPAPPVPARPDAE